jgi:DNA-binding MarR family transcriptional regulator
MADERRPIGYWLKHLDRLIEDAFERALASEGLTRRHWQVLNTLRTRPSGSAEIADALAPFLGDDPGAGGRVIDDLVVRGWVESRQNELLSLTEEGIQAQAAMLQLVAVTRQVLVEGISEDEYRATIDVLRRMVANLERAAE